MLAVFLSRQYFTIFITQNLLQRHFFLVADLGYLAKKFISLGLSPSAKDEDTREYHKAGVKGYLRNNEDPEKCSQILEELKEAFKVRKAHIDKLYDEVKQIKKLKV